MAKRSVIITGAAAGIGAACAEKFAHAGDNLILVDTDEDGGQAIAKRLSSDQNSISFVQADIASKLHVHNIIAEALETNGRVDALVHASVGYFAAPFLETGEEDLQKILNQNLVGTFLINQAVAKQMVRQIDDAAGENAPSRNGGQNYAIVNVGTIDGVATQSDHVAFAASQGGLQQMTKGIALSLCPHSIRVNTVGVGIMRGEQNPLWGGQPVAPLERVGEPGEAANVAFFLTSEEASFVTGQTVFVDGGQLVRSSSPDASKKKA